MRSSDPCAVHRTHALIRIWKCCSCSSWFCNVNAMVVSHARFILSVLTIWVVCPCRVATQLLFAVVRPAICAHLTSVVVTAVVIAALSVIVDIVSLKCDLHWLMPHDTFMVLRGSRTVSSSNLVHFIGIFPSCRSEPYFSRTREITKLVRVQAVPLLHVLSMVRVLHHFQPVVKAKVNHRARFDSYKALSSRFVSNPLSCEGTNIVLITRFYYAIVKTITVRMVRGVICPTAQLFLIVV